ncbi:hypothetical protein OG785_24585 [Streptomyces sp. NBC_00006]|uniref:hypothetical protein n=1 Tax=Streptomyces sp. NBC_00006 TaxID=2975619 RepID=UPI00225C145D|nr:MULTISPECIES: hypothetical protein [unclassified Streptomyces]MCX5533716.1 hypothetical protein [Streptomyces sp. NBC_00006]
MLAVAAPATAAQGGLEVYPATAAPGDRVTVDTTACGGSDTATGDASAVGAGTFTLAPATPNASNARGRFRIPVSAQPGTYEIVAKCASGPEVTGDLIVSVTGTGASVAQLPRGHVNTGVGGALGPEPTRTSAGVAALALAAAGGTWLLHRRARGDRI